ncbi:hypothetical protein E2320_014600 [Naja naja]|nr:hypothetical protein E2320_014600 [Naja naja]
MSFLPSQINYGIISHTPEQNHHFPFLYQLTPKQEPSFSAIIKLLLHFRWTWIGLISQENEKGESFRRSLTNLAVKNEICIVFSEIIPTMNMDRSLRGKRTEGLLSVFSSQIKIIICQLDYPATATLSSLIQYTDSTNEFTGGKVWIAATLSDISLRIFYYSVDLQRKHALFSFLTQTKTRTQYYIFNSFSHIATQFGMEAFQCSHSRPVWSKKVWERCTEKENWEFPPNHVVARILSEDGSGIFKAIQALALVLSAVSSSQFNKRRMLFKDHQSAQIVQPWQVRILLQGSTNGPLSFPLSSPETAMMTNAVSGLPYLRGRGTEGGWWLNETSDFWTFSCERQAASGTRVEPMRG